MVFKSFGHVSCCASLKHNIEVNRSFIKESSTQHAEIMFLSFEDLEPSDFKVHPEDNCFGVFLDMHGRFSSTVKTVSFFQLRTWERGLTKHGEM